MNRLSKLVAATCLLSIGCTAHASVNGTWWNPSQPGLGWAFKSQNDTIFALQYAYEGSAATPTFRSCIGSISYSTFVDGHMRETFTGDCYRTENFNMTVRTGAFTGTYEFGKISLNAAGFVQNNLVPFDFGYASPIDQLVGVWLFSPIATLGSAPSVTAVFSPTSSIIGGLPARTVATTDGQTGAVGYDAVNKLYLAYTQTSSDRINGVASIFIFPTSPVAYAPLVGQLNEDVLIGTTCRANTVNFQCFTTPIDLLGKSIANSPLEVAVLRNFLVSVPISTTEMNASAVEASTIDFSQFATAAKDMLDAQQKRMTVAVAKAQSDGSR